MKILFADKFPESRQQQLKDLGHSLTFLPDLSAETIPGAIAGHEALVVRSTKVTKETVAAGQALKLIIRAGAGTNTIDKVAANAAGMHVTNCPGKNSVAVAELAMGLMLAIDRRIPQATAALKQRQWNKKEFSKADGIKGKTLGIVGMGAIGKELARRALAFDMTVLGYDVVPFDAPGVEAVSVVEDLLRRADVISLHIPANDKTKQFMNRERLALLKKGAILLNTSRGEIVDEQALIEAIRERGLRVGADVFANEPAAATGQYEGELALLDNVVATHHIGASTEQAQLAVADEVIAIVQAYARDGSVLNEVRA
ncbi:MAG: NAD(P)-dependent oxidoreductase [Pseudomonadota bacterium]